MRRARGFTLLELMTVVAIVGILAAASIVTFNSASRTANLASATYDLVVRLSGLRSQAMSNGFDHLLVFVDAPGGDASQCRWSNSTGCARYYILSKPGPDWSISTFDPASPAGAGTATAEIVDEQPLPRNAHLNAADSSFPTLPAPFTAVSTHDADLVASCAGGRACFAVRFTARGQVEPERVAPGTVAKAGFAFVLAGEAAGSGTERRRILVSFPGGIVRSASL
jgi:prepilin-type N-terminal cleavage/methylation domain-containing protein